MGPKAVDVNPWHMCYSRLFVSLETLKVHHSHLSLYFWSKVISKKNYPWLADMTCYAVWFQVLLISRSGSPKCWMITCWGYCRKSLFKEELACMMTLKITKNFKVLRSYLTAQGAKSRTYINTTWAFYKFRFLEKQPNSMPKLMKFSFVSYCALNLLGLQIPILFFWSHFTN